MKANDLLDMIGNVDDNMIADAKRQKKPARRTWTRWAAAAACLCLAAGGVLIHTKLLNKNENHVRTWTESYTAADYFKYAGNGNGSSTEMSIADYDIPYAESRDFSGDRSLMEENGVIPSMDTHPLFYAQSHFNDDGSLYSVEMSWHRRDLKGTEHYSDLSIVAGYEEVPIIEDCIMVEVDDNGIVLEPAVTITERDGVRIIARVGEKQNKTITFQNETGWYQIAGSWNDSYEDTAALFEWFWNHPLDFSKFNLKSGDVYTYTTIDDMPDAFSDILPDFTAHGFACGYSSITLKNGNPSAYYAVYVSYVTEEEAKKGAYTPGENGVVQIDWYVTTEPDFYELEGCIGDLKSISKDRILNLTPPDNITTQCKIQLRQDDSVLIIWTSDLNQAWELVESLRAG